MRGSSAIVASTPLASFDRLGESSPAGDNSANFLGVRNDVANIGRIAFDVGSGLALNQLDLITSGTPMPPEPPGPGPTPVPEPDTLHLLATALAGAVAAGRRGRS